MDELQNNLNKLKTKFCKVESDLHISQNVNDKLPDKLVVLEQKCHANEQYFKRECLPRNFRHSYWSGGYRHWKKNCCRFWMQSTLLLTQIWLKTTIVYSHKVPQKVNLKLNCLKNARQVLLNKKNLKQLKPDSLNFSEMQEITACQPNFVLLGQQWIHKSQVGERKRSHNHTWLWFGENLRWWSINCR